jgi:dTDP-4-amino-4,6-dideoxygalactose transaminase
MPEIDVPVADPGARIAANREAVRAAIDRVLGSGCLILGPEVGAFEREFAAWLGAHRCVGTGNGTDALSLALRAVGVVPGDEVVTVSLTAVATVAAIEMAGAVPVLADVTPHTRCMDPAAIEGLLSARTRAILPVHLHGQPADMAAILAVASRHGVAVVEDCAQAHGAAIGDRRVGTFGDAAAFSFYPTKNLGGIGDGGAVAAATDAAADAVRSLREYGWSSDRVSERPGVNSRLDEIQAAVLRALLPELDAWNARRRAIAGRYRAALAGSGIVAPPEVPGTTSAMHQFVVECPDRDGLARRLAAAGIGTAVHYPIPVHRQPAYAGRLRGAGRLPVTESLSCTILSLPVFPEMSDAQVDRVCGVLAGC